MKRSLGPFAAMVLGFVLAMCSPFPTAGGGLILAVLSEGQPGGSWSPPGESLPIWTGVGRLGVTTAIGDFVYRCEVRGGHPWALRWQSSVA